jgi:hypothetical protein
MLIINNKYTIPILLAILALIKESTRTSKVSKALIFKIVKLKKLANKID